MTSVCQIPHLLDPNHIPPCRGKMRSVDVLDNPEVPFGDGRTLTDVSVSSIDDDSALPTSKLPLYQAAQEEQKDTSTFPILFRLARGVVVCQNIMTEEAIS